MHHSPAEGNFRDEHGNALKSATIQDYNQHMGYVDKNDTDSISRRAWKWTKKLSFHLLDLTVLNSYIILHSFCSKLCYRGSRLNLIRDFIQEGERVLGTQIIPQSANPFYQPAGSQTRSALARERDKAQVSCMFRAKEAE
jgi:hypothetical protein